MEKSFKEALANRRSFYALTGSSPVPDKEIEDIIVFAANNVPSAFNSQTTRMVLLLGENHKALWNIVKETLKKIVPEQAYSKTEQKIDNSFASGYGTVLFFEDGTTIKKLETEFPLYKDNLKNWSQQTSGMHQLVVWTMLENAGFGVSLQHYNPLIDEEVRKKWNLPADWVLIGQMPFGKPLDVPRKKELQPIEKRVKIFK
ncbi:MAG: nitroreductase family protein [Prevotellaceae bacterium]|jgi:predicted oxidoreductase (fatty acid repression mutant protein)|nr:nitroreductase family protein [Prevotellaceae bacterium]